MDKHFSPQVSKSHYSFDNYYHRDRWSSLWLQLHEVINLAPSSVLEIGPGLGLFKNLASFFGINIKTLDIDTNLCPDYVASVFNLPFSDNEFDAVGAFQMLEHLPYVDTLQAFHEICRVANKHVILSLPDAKIVWPQRLVLPKIGVFQFFIPRPTLSPVQHEFDGEHYWEINKKGYPLKKIIYDLSSVSSPFQLTRTYRNPQFPYHRFFVFSVD